ncbi:unnamed protein product [Cyclocybe aegerita]|uniref:Transcription activator of gluconeogenesis ERT1 n=1 Tax=Cyclocybe aegerita TaxID=1973307 RepID=A0A8S0WQ41_CYCAE|nr:unnamed protein product [Cyclocybe aegerita]
MPSVEDKALDGEEPLEPPSHMPTHALHSAAFSGMPVHVYPFPHSLLPTQQPLRSKRRQVKNACTNCQKACKKCDDARPCLRCVKYGVSEECVDSQRKERKKGIKRGPYKKRDGKGNSVDHTDVPTQGVPVSNTVPPPGGPPIPGGYLPVGYPPPPGFYPQYPPAISKQGDSPPVYSAQPYFLAPVPHMQGQLHTVSEDETRGYSPEGFYQPAIITPVPYHPHYSIARPNGEGAIQSHYPMYSTVYPKETMGGQGEVINNRSGGQELVVNCKQD